MQSNIQKHRAMVASRIFNNTLNATEFSQPISKGEDVIHDKKDITWEGEIKNLELRKSFDTLGIANELEETAEAIEKSHISGEFLYGGDKMTFKKKGSELKQMVQIKSNAYAVKKAQLESKKKECKEELEEQGIEFIDSEGTGEYPKYDHEKMQNNEDLAKQVRQCDHLCYQIQAINKDEKILNVMLANLEDGKQYELTLSQLASLS